MFGNVLATPPISAKRFPRMLGNHERHKMKRSDASEERLTYDIEEVARLLGVGRNQAYESARRGDFPTIRIGKRLLAPKAGIKKLLDPQ
jgi:excisionase family DNA binding protein